MLHQLFKNWCKGGKSNNLTLACDAQANQSDSYVYIWIKVALKWLRAYIILSKWK